MVFEVTSVEIDGVSGNTALPTHTWRKEILSSKAFLFKRIDSAPNAV